MGGSVPGTRKRSRNCSDCSRDAQAVHRQWRHKLRGGHAALQAEFDTLVRGATRIRNFEVMLIPGLLQTAGLCPLPGP